MRKVDKLGRIVIPLELRKKHGLSEGASIEFIDAGDGITVKSSEPCCKICQVKIADDVSFPLCDDCIAKIAEHYKNGK